MDAPKFRRITVSEVEAAARKVGFSIKSRISIDRDARCGCPMGVVLIASDPDRAFPVGYDTTDLGMDLGLEQTYALSFAFAFDEGREPVFAWSPLSKAGTEDGLACRRAFLPKEFA